MDRHGRHDFFGADILVSHGSMGKGNIEVIRDRNELKIK